MRITAESPHDYLIGTVADDADLDGQFWMCTDDDELLCVNGWLFVIEIVPEIASDPQGE